MAEYTEELEELNTNIAVVSFVSNEHWAYAWLEDTQSPFPLLIDRDKNTYSAFNLTHSVAGSWSLRVLWFYIKTFFTGRKLKGIQGDPNQLGGDFIIDQTGIVRYIYRSQDSLDRPDISDLFEALRKLN